MGRVYPSISSRRSFAIFRNVWSILLVRTSFMVVSPIIYFMNIRVEYILPFQL